MGKALSEVEKQEITATLKSGLSQTATVKKYGRSAGLVNKLAQAADIDPVNNRTAQANEARRVYCREERLRVNDLLFDKILQMLNKCTKSVDLRNILVSYGIATDKRILETIEEPSFSGEGNAKEKLLSILLESTQSGSTNSGA